MHCNYFAIVKTKKIRESGSIYMHLYTFCVKGCFGHNNGVSVFNKDSFFYMRN